MVICLKYSPDSGSRIGDRLDSDWESASTYAHFGMYSRMLRPQAQDYFEA
jgi:hypothetical protein